jgi:hypothetical protein
MSNVANAAAHDEHHEHATPGFYWMIGGILAVGIVTGVGIGE